MRSTCNRMGLCLGLRLHLGSSPCWALPPSVGPWFWEGPAHSTPRHIDMLIYAGGLFGSPVLQQAPVSPYLCLPWCGSSASAGSRFPFPAWAGVVTGRGGSAGLVRTSAATACVTSCGSRSVLCTWYGVASCCMYACMHYAVWVKHIAA